LGQELELVESGRWIAPFGFEVAGASGPSNGELLVWSKSEAVVLNGSLKVVRQIQFPIRESPLAVELLADGAIELLTGSPGTIHRLDPNGHLLESEPIPVSGGIIHGALFGDGWILLTSDQSPSQPSYALFRFSKTGLSPFARVPFVGVLSSQGQRVFLAKASAPHTVLAFQPDGQFHQFETDTVLVSSLSEDTRDGSPRTWVSLPVLEIGDRHLQTITDITSDQRVLVIYGPTGAVLRAKRIRAPVGFVASASEGGALFSVLHMNQTEIVRYRWRWRNQ
jgi:hypothetical protein